jgi:hypothetical protein
MTTLDTLARSSALAINSSVSHIQVPARGIAGAAKAVAIWRVVGYALAGATAGAAVVVALLLAGSSVDDPTQDFAPTTNAVVPSTIPDEPVARTTIPESQDALPVAPVSGGDAEKDEGALPDTTPPMLEVTSPSDGEHVSSMFITFSGITERDATVVASGKFPADVGSDGSWSVDLVLTPGANGVVFRAVDPFGNESEVRLTVHLDVEEPSETTTTITSEWVFTADQKYGSCSEPVPYDVFTGKAEPGTTVSVTSPHGGGTVAVDGEGKWSVRVEFKTAPYNVEFTVTVKDQSGASKSYAFVSLYEG